MTRPLAAPILPPDEAATWARARRGEGCTLALANGCFELLHVGHLRFLQAAAEQADLLIVGVNDDASVGALKGPGRPLVPAPERAAVIAALRCVDLVTIFPERTADGLLYALHPDVHCKGADYAGGVPEGETVRAIGARIAIVGGPKDHSVTRLLHRIREVVR